MLILCQLQDLQDHQGSPPKLLCQPTDLNQSTALSLPQHTLLQYWGTLPTSGGKGVKNEENWEQ